MPENFENRDESQNQEENKNVELTNTFSDTYKHDISRLPPQDMPLEERLELSLSNKDKYSVWELLDSLEPDEISQLFNTHGNIEAVKIAHENWEKYGTIARDIAKKLPPTLKALTDKKLLSGAMILARAYNLCYAQNSRGKMTEDDFLGDIEDIAKEHFVEGNNIVERKVTEIPGILTNADSFEYYNADVVREVIAYYTQWEIQSLKQRFLPGLKKSSAGVREEQKTLKPYIYSKRTAKWEW